MRGISWPQYKRLVFERTGRNCKFRFVLAERKPKGQVRVNKAVIALLNVRCMPAGVLVLE